MTWFWLNWLLGALIVMAYCSIPVWLVPRQRGTTSQPGAVAPARLFDLAGSGPAGTPVTAASVDRDAA